MLVAAVEDMLDITVVGNTDTIIQSNRKSLNSTLQLKQFCGKSTANAAVWFRCGTTVR